MAQQATRQNDLSYRGPWECCRPANVCVCVNIHYPIGSEVLNSLTQLRLYPTCVEDSNSLY
jgi:hypothetical protein